MAKIVSRQMPTPQDLPQQIPTSRAKAKMQKPQGGTNFGANPQGCAGGWLWQKLIAA